MFVNCDTGKSDMVINNCTFENNVWENEIHVVHNKHGYWSQVYFEDQKATAIDGRTLVPVRGVLENMGYVVEWDGDTKTAIITNPAVNLEVRVTLDSKIIYKGDETIEIDVPACVLNERTMVPLRAITEAFDMRVEWDGIARCVVIYAE